MTADQPPDDARRPTTVRTRWELVAPFRVLQVEASVRRWGYRASDFMSGKLSWLDHIHPDDFDPELARLQHDVSFAETFPVSITSYRFRLADGSWRRLASVNVFEFTPDGRPLVASSLLSDDPRAVQAVLARRAQEERREEDHHRLSAILRHAADPIVLCDAAGRAIWANNAWSERTGLPFDALQDRSVCATLEEEPVNQVTLAGLGDAIRDGTSYRGDLFLPSVDGVERWYSTDCVPVLRPDRSLTGFMLMLHDVTAEREAREALAAQEQRVRDLQRLDAIGRLAAGVAHDFGNLLQIIGGSLELLDTGLPATHPLRRHAKAGRVAVERASDLSRQLLQFGKPSRAVPQVMDVRDVLTALEPMLRRLVRENITLHVTVPPYPLHVRLERTEVEQVVVNLVSNASAAIEGPGDIWIGLARVVLPNALADARQVAPGSYVELLVRDSGAGIAPAVLARAFEPFYSTKGSGGTGLGLSTVYGIARHGGGYAVGATGAPTRRGTTFRVGLPEAVSLQDVDDESPPAVSAAMAVAPAPPRDTARVLVVEDDPGVAAFFRESLELAGFVVDVAADAAAALARLAADAPPVEVLVSDIVMPGKSGPELVAAARRLQPGLPALFVSGYFDEALASHREALADTPLLRKPCTGEALVAAIRTLLAGRRPPPAAERA